MRISKAEALRAIDEEIVKLEKDMAACASEPSVQALNDRVKDYQALREFICSRRAADKTTSWSQLVWVDACRLKNGQSLLREYTESMKQIVLPYLAFTFQKSSPYIENFLY